MKTISRFPLLLVVLSDLISLVDASRLQKTSKRNSASFKETELPFPDDAPFNATLGSGTPLFTLPETLTQPIFAFIGATYNGTASPPVLTILYGSEVKARFLFRGKDGLKLISPCEI
jgi:hypothetical protein